jgi:hypothetical protein
MEHGRSDLPESLTQCQQRIGELEEADTQTGTRQDEHRLEQREENSREAQARCRRKRAARRAVTAS